MEIHNTLDMRERYIITQALVIAINELKKVPAPFTEISNIADMEYLLETTFTEFAGIFEHLVNAEKVVEGAK
jgi:hypothetical protein